MASDTPPSGPDPAPHSSLQEDWEKHFGDLIHTSSANLIRLGTYIRRKVFGVKTTRARVVESRCIHGIFSLVFILELDDTKMVIHLPACGRSGNLTGPAKAWLNSHVQTLKYVRSHTQIPVPEVYDSDPTGINDIAAPYIAMSHTDGRMVKDLWFDESGPTPLETRRLRILGHLAQLMPQLHVQRFDKIGSLGPAKPPDGPAPADDRDPPKLGPCFRWDYMDGGFLTINSSAPFESSKAWLENCRASLPETPGESDLRDGCYKLLETLLSLMPNQTSDFALAPYNLDWENVLADEDGTITGLINWDHAQTTPDFLGCLRYPTWILHNLDPPNGNPNLSGSEKRQGYRAYYLEQIQMALDGQGRADDYTYTANSPAAYFFWVAYIKPEVRVRYCQGFVEAAKKRLGSEDALPPDLRETPLRILENLGGDRLQDEVKAALEKGFKAFMGY